MKDGDKASIRTNLRHLVGAGFERSSGWMHTLAAVAAFSSDVLKPLLPHCTPAIVVIGFVAFTAVWVLTRAHWINATAGAGVLVFLLMTTVLSTAVYAAQRMSGDPPEGEFAHISPAIKGLQRTLNIVDDRTRRIEQNTTTIIGMLKDRGEPKPSTIVAHIGGLWGEGDCSAVSYTFTLQNRALTIDGVNRPAGASPYHFVGTIIQQSDLSLEVRGEEPDSAKGLEVTFGYEGNGLTERLQWQDHVAHSTMLELNRCD